MLEQTDYQHFEREACYNNLINFPQRQESGCYSEVNILVLCEVTTKSVAMKLRRKAALRGRQQQREHEKVSESISVVVRDSDSSQSDSVEEIQKSVAMKRRRKTALRGRWQQREHEVSESISVVLNDTDSSQPNSVEEIQKSVSMKLRRKTAQRGRQQKREHEKVYESISVVLNDTDSSQSNSVEEIKDHVSVIHEMKRPIKKCRAGASCRLSEEDERPLSIVKPQYGAVQKITLAPGAMAEDTLGKLRVMANTSDSGLRPKSSVESREESVLDESSTDLMVASGPSSPCHPVDTIRCKECESLFAQMRRRPTPKEKIRDRNPESLSCDEWILLKRWHPQRDRHREKGLLWKSLSHIRKLSAQGSDSAVFNRTQVNCSRPHVFQQRSLRRCKYLSSIQTDLSITKAKRRHRKRPRAVLWPPVGGWKSSVKRKSSINDTLSQQLYPLDLSVSVTQDDKLIVDDQISRLNADHKQNSDASSKQRRTFVQGKLNKQEASDGIDGTRRVLKFDDTPETVAVETAEQRKSPRHQQERREGRVAQNVLQQKQRVELFEDSEGFRTPTDLFNVKPKIKRGNQRKVSASGDTKSAVQKPNFKSMLATMVKNQNQIIKESC
ncbi:uncharacterized protein si:ch211-227n13.3 isoform X1 [Pimephales promelas]|uniref:uncharacterized protein si:ch211-227n13.3 isoform X1 n=2 Tax=Pimephales promelas TaxID=90988 RepID=UPI001955F066|nr:uncharacterized protein si:ch211-227n13.3 isoform X1 [Pimephales promelas]XP_039530194.1 uncharacterized protein si:ch211-227n13.3 isoform X1 [Pimephales promelas]